MKGAERMGFGERLRELREQKGYSQKEFAQKIQLSSSAVSHFESGKNYPKWTVLFHIMQVLECDANYLFQDYMNPEQRYTKEEAQLLAQYRQLSLYGKHMIHAMMTAACVETDTYFNHNDFIQKKLFISQSGGSGSLNISGTRVIYLQAAGRNLQADYCLKITDEMMAPTYRRGDILLVKKERVRHNETGLFELNGHKYAARLFICEGKVKLSLFNRSIKPFIVNSSMKYKRLGKIIGKIEGKYSIR